MTRTELEHILRVLKKIKEPDVHVLAAISSIDNEFLMWQRRSTEMRKERFYDYEPPLDGM